MRIALLEPLPETIAAWHDSGCPDVFAEVRDAMGCWIVGTMEIKWVSPYSTRPVVRVREVVPHSPLAADEPTVTLAGGFVLHPPSPELIAAIARAETARRRSMRPCADCGEATPPEHGAALEHGFTCHGCMERNHGVDF